MPERLSLINVHVTLPIKKFRKKEEGKKKNLHQYSINAMKILIIKLNL